MADALASGASVRKDVGVQVPPRPPIGDLSGVLVSILHRIGQDPAPDSVRRSPMGRRQLFPRVLISSAVLLGCGDTARVDTSESTVVVETIAPSTRPVTSTSVPEMSVAPTTIVTSSKSVFTFVSADEVNEWFVVNDTVMGGVSSGRLGWENAALVFTGDLSLDNNGGFASIRSPFLDPAVVVAWAERDGLTVEVGGDGRTWTMEVRTDFGDGGWISAIATSAEEVTAVDVPWVSFQPVTRFLDPRPATVPLDPARIVSVAFYLVDGIEAPFRLELHSIT